MKKVLVIVGSVVEGLRTLKLKEPVEGSEVTEISFRDEDLGPEFKTIDAEVELEIEEARYDEIFFPTAGEGDGLSADSESADDVDSDTEGASSKSV